MAGKSMGEFALELDTVGVQGIRTQRPIAEEVFGQDTSCAFSFSVQVLIFFQIIIAERSVL